MCDEDKAAYSHLEANTGASLYVIIINSHYLEEDEAAAASVCEYAESSEAPSAAVAGLGWWRSAHCALLRAQPNELG